MKLAKSTQEIGVGRLKAFVKENADMKCAFFFMAAIAVSLVHGATYTWTNALGDGDWSKLGNFLVGGEGTGTVPDTLPGSGDNVYVEANTTVTLEYDPDDAAKLASCNAFAGVGRIRPRANTTFNITVKEGAVFPLSCSISLGVSEANHNAGHIVKLGGGELDLNSVGASKSGNEYYDYYCAMTVDEGVVRLPQDGSIDNHYHLGDVTVNANGTLFTAKTSGANSTEFYNLYGSGVITNDSVHSRMKVNKRFDFSGRMGGRVYYYSEGWATLTGVESTMLPSDFIVYMNYGHGVTATGYGSVDVAKFGVKPRDGVYDPSSIGFATNIYTRDHGGAIRYIGRGETTDKDLRLWPQSTSEATYLDGGPHGGLVWTGLWAQRDQAIRYMDPTMLRLILQGSNTEECVMSGKIQNILKDGTNYTFCITKQGTGTWRMVHNDGSDMRGVWRVVNGTLRFDTIAEAGVNSALGKSTCLYKDLSGVLALDENKVDYAFWLGGGTSTNRPNMEYVGATNCVSTRRRFAVTGKGGVLNNGGGFLRLSDFVATNTATTLFLGGTNKLDNVADGIADGGNATMSVTKEGSGTWRLGTNCTFTGTLDVKGGRLEIGNPEKYEYYRWIVKESFLGSATRNGSTSQMFGLRSFGLFDADGNDRTYGVTDDGEWVTDSYYKGIQYNYGVFDNALQVGEGHVRITHYDGSALKLSRFSNSVMADLFSHKDLYGFVWCRDTRLPPWHESPNTWITFTIHPVQGAPITSWDFVNCIITNSNNSKSYQLIKMCELQASVDGRAWDSLASLDYDGYTSEYRPPINTWRSDNTTAYQVGYTTHTTGMPIPPGPTNEVRFAASSVSVAAGAELIARAPEKPVIRELAVDGSGGTIDGFAFAPDCTISVTNVAANGVVPMTLRNVDGIDSTSGWTVSLGGRRKASLRVSASATGFKLMPVGTQFLIR